MVSRDIDPEGVTWSQAAVDPDFRDEYNFILQKHGFNPISRRCSANQIHSSQDWTISVRLDIEDDRDVLAMKWKLY